MIRQCLEKDPSKRPPDYVSLDRALEEAAKTRSIRYRRFVPQLRYAMPMVGARTFGDYLKSAKGTWNAAGTRRIVEGSEIEQFMREADALLAVGDYKKAEEILGSLFVPEMVTALPDYPYNQAVAIAYAECLVKLGRADEAIEALECLSAGKRETCRVLRQPLTCSDQKIRPQCRREHRTRRIAAVPR